MAKLADMEFTSKSPNTFTLNDTKNGLDFSTDLGSGKIKTNDGKTLEESVMVEITGGGLSQPVTGTADADGNFQIPVVWTGVTPNFTINLTKLTKYNAPSAFDWSCEKRDPIFTVTKK